MKYRRTIFYLLTSILLMFVITNSYTNQIYGFEIGTIENKDDWVISSNIANFSNDFHAKMVFGFENETLGIGIYPYLTFHTNIDIPFNFTGYLNKEIKKQVGIYGIQVSGYPGNITIGLNGTVFVKTPITDVFYIEIEEGTTEFIADFESFIGENVSIPINFNPMIFSLSETEIADISSISLVIDPELSLEGTIFLSATVKNEELIWRTGNEIYFENTNVSNEMSDYVLTLNNISLNFQELSLRMKIIETTIILETALGEIRFNYPIDLQNVEWIEGEKIAGEFVVFLIDTLIKIDDQNIFMKVFRASISPFTTLITIIVISILIPIRRRKNSS